MQQSGREARLPSVCDAAGISAGLLYRLGNWLTTAQNGQIPPWPVRLGRSASFSLRSRPQTYLGGALTWPTQWSFLPSRLEHLAGNKKMVRISWRLSRNLGSVAVRVIDKIRIRIRIRVSCLFRLLSLMEAKWLLLMASRIEQNSKIKRILADWLGRKQVGEDKLLGSTCRSPCTSRLGKNNLLKTSQPLTWQERLFALKWWGFEMRQCEPPLHFEDLWTGCTFVNFTFTFTFISQIPGIRPSWMHQSLFIFCFSSFSFLMWQDPRMASSVLVFLCTRISVANHVTIPSPPSTSIAPHLMTWTWAWTCPWVWKRWGQRATSATPPTSHGYRPWHTAFNKIVMLMGIPPKSKPNASVLKQ